MGEWGSQRPVLSTRGSGTRNGADLDWLPVQVLDESSGVEEFELNRPRRSRIVHKSASAGPVVELSRL